MPYPPPWPAEVAEGLIDVRLAVEAAVDADGERSPREQVAIAVLGELQDRVEEIDTEIAEYVSVIRTGGTCHWHTRRRKSRQRTSRSMTHV